MSEEEKLRNEILRAIRIIEKNKLFVHSNKINFKVGKRDLVDQRIISEESYEFPEILTLCILNALVPKGSLLLVGGHGGGKTTLLKFLGRIFTSIPIDEIEKTILRGHPQLTEEKMIATLDIIRLLGRNAETEQSGSLPKETQLNREDYVIWGEFVDCFWKIIDEVNRLSPPAQDILLSLLAEGVVKYIDFSKEIKDFILFATVNPVDIGSFPLSLPFRDRFGLAIPVSIPKISDLNYILTRRDEKLIGYDETEDLPGILSEEQLKKIWNFVDNIEPADPQTENFISSIISEFNLCDYIDKGNNKIGDFICKDCHFNTEKNVCNKIYSILSVRAARDLQRYSKALAWFLNLKTYNIDIIEAIAPYVIWNRVDYNQKELNKPNAFGDKLKFTRHLIEIIKNNFVGRLPIYQILEKFLKAKGTEEDLLEVEEYSRNDLITKNNILPEIRDLNTEKYINIYSEIEINIKNNDFKRISELEGELYNKIIFPGRNYLSNIIERYILKTNCKLFTLSLNNWKKAIELLRIKFPEMYSDLKKSISEDFQTPSNINHKTLKLSIKSKDLQKNEIIIGISGFDDATRAKDILEIYKK